MLHTLELPKLPEEADGSELWTWLEFINAESEAELKILVKREPKMRAPEVIGNKPRSCDPGIA